MIDPHLREEEQAQVNSRVLRQFAALWVIVLAVLAYWHGVPGEGSFFGWLSAALIVVPGLAGLALPAIIRPVFLLLTLITKPIGWLVSHLILGALFYGLFTLVGLIFKLVGRDGLNRRYRPDLETYWIATPNESDPRSYFRQA